MTKATWILDLPEDFPSSRAVLERRPEAIVVSKQDVLMGRWPALEGPLVGYGSMLAMTRLAARPELGRAVFDDYAALRCSSYYRWLYDLLGRACVLVPFTALAHLPLARMFGERVFVRSDSNFKLFPAEVHSIESLARWSELYQSHQNEMLVLSEAVELGTEYRCFCRGGRFVCGSSYPDENYWPVPPEAVSFAEVAAERLLLQGIRMCTIDVAVHKGQLRLVEAGGVNSWGLYGGDLDAFLASMEAEAVRVFEEDYL